MDKHENICMPCHWSQLVYGEIVPGYELEKKHHWAFRKNFANEGGQHPMNHLFLAAPADPSYKRLTCWW